MSKETLDQFIQQVSDSEELQARIGEEIRCRLIECTGRKMSKIFLIALWLLIGLAPASAANRGLTTVTATAASGEAIELYQGSHALLIGASQYQDNQWPDLESIPRELNLVAKALEGQGFVVEKHFDPDSRELEDHFRNFIDRYGYDKQNRLLFFFAGHGYTRDDGNKGYLVPVDAPSPLEDEKGFQRKALPMSQVLAWARDTEAKHSLFLFDSCFSGTVFMSRALPDRPPAINRLVSLPVRQFITAGSAGETVPAKSTFTPMFVDAIKQGKGDLNRDGYVSGTELGLYLQQEVPRHVDQTPQFGKIQEYELSRGDYIFVVNSGSTQAVLTSVDNTQSISSAPATGVVSKNQSTNHKALELEFWQSIKDSDSPELYRAYLNQFPGGTYAAIAKVKLKTANQPQQGASQGSLSVAAVSQTQTALPSISKEDPRFANITGLWVDKYKCHISIVKDSAGSLVGAAWGPYRGSMQIELKPLIENQRRFDWKGGRRTDSVDPSLIDPKRKGRFTINTYDRNQLHTTTNICSHSVNASVATFKRAPSQTSYQVKPPRWVVSK